VLVFNRMTLVSVSDWEWSGRSNDAGAWWNWERRLRDERGDLQLLCLQHNTIEWQPCITQFFPFTVSPLNLSPVFSFTTFSTSFHFLVYSHPLSCLQPHSSQHLPTSIGQFPVCLHVLPLKWRQSILPKHLSLSITLQCIMYLRIQHCQNFSAECGLQQIGKKWRQALTAWFEVLSWYVKSCSSSYHQTERNGMTQAQENDKNCPNSFLYRIVLINIYYQTSSWWSACI
jgi:hypothetical protein